jgi:hypothetical protein
VASRRATVAPASRSKIPVCSTTRVKSANRLFVDGQRLGLPDYRHFAAGQDGEEAGRYLPFAMVSADMNIRTALSRSLGVDRRRPLRREIPNRIATFRMVSGGRLMRFAISSDDRAFAASSSKRRSSAKDQRCFLCFPVIELCPTGLRLHPQVDQAAWSVGHPQAAGKRDFPREGDQQIKGRRRRSDRLPPGRWGQGKLSIR